MHFPGNNPLKYNGNGNKHNLQHLYIHGFIFKRVFLRAGAPFAEPGVAGFVVPTGE
jgi:hypothetical protein